MTDPRSLHKMDGAPIVEIWVVHLDVPEAVSGRLEEWLAPDERARAGRFRFDRDRRRYLVSHAALRAILARRIDTEPRRVRIEAGPQGKPRLAADASTVRFNLAHSGEMALCAVTSGVEVGVDLEEWREVRDAEAILHDQFAPSEVEDWQRLPPAMRSERFLRLWTCKEAWLKACGLGLSQPIDLSEICLSGDSAHLRSVNGSEAEAMRWTLRTFEPAMGYVGAVCVEAPSADLQWRRWVEPR